MNDVEAQMLQKRYDASQVALGAANSKIERLEGAIAVLEMQKRQWGIEKAQQMEIITQQLQSQGALVTRLQDEIIELREAQKDDG